TKARNPMTAEQARLDAARAQHAPWKKWGPYLSKRQWGTVREDYSEGGNAWDYFSHDQARSRAYRWGEDGLAGFSDDQQRLCFALALWNGKDPILKERLFGLTNSEGNHGEDVKEYYFYLDSTPSRSTPRARRRTSWSRSPSTTAAPRRPSCTCCRPCGSATSGPGAPRPPGRGCAARTPASSRSSTRRSAPATCTATA